MRIVRMTLDDQLVAAVDRAAGRLGISRSAFARKALSDAIWRLTVEETERKHREGYLHEPVRRGEFSGWEREQVWAEP
jgi:metal-responsive CopG/Arc/MetJ family transcriptional regulator